jgi:flagellar biogenesis protein FliO
MDIVTIVAICAIIALIIILIWLQIKKIQKQREPIAEGPASHEIFKLVSQVKYPSGVTVEQGSIHNVTAIPQKSQSEQTPKKIDLLKNRVDITDSLKALAEKYFVREITLATDDGLVLASSGGRDVQADAAKFSQIVKRQMAPDEPGVTIFELYHKETHLTLIIRSDKDPPWNWKKDIKEDTKGILQCWL